MCIKPGFAHSSVSGAGVRDHQSRTPFPLHHVSPQRSGASEVLPFIAALDVLCLPVNLFLFGRRGARWSHKPQIKRRNCLPDRLSMGFQANQLFIEVWTSSVSPSLFRISVRLLGRQRLLRQRHPSQRQKKRGPPSRRPEGYEITLRRRRGSKNPSRGVYHVIHAA